MLELFTTSYIHIGRVGAEHIAIFGRDIERRWRGAIGEKNITQISQTTGDLCDDRLLHLPERDERKTSILDETYSVFYVIIF